MREGTVVGSYRIVGRLGEGGMGAVYLGEHELLGRRVAIKILLPAFSAQRDVVERFFNEARATTAIRDPGVVQIFDFGFDAEGAAFLVMELLEGEPLDLRLRRLGRLAAADALRLIRQVAGTLAAAHAIGIVHRDLKPENIFMVSDPEMLGGERAKLLDFGIAKLGGGSRGNKTRTGVMMGTPTYMSPEQCRDSSSIDHRSDIYSLGAVLFHLLTGGPPFDCDSAGEVIASHLRTPARPPSADAPGLPAMVDDVVLRCLAKEPAARFDSMVELQQAIDRVLARLTGGELAARPQPSWPPTTMMMPLPAPALTPMPLVTPMPRMTPVPEQPTTLGGATGQRLTTGVPVTAPPSPPPPSWRSSVRVALLSIIAALVVIGGGFVGVRAWGGSSAGGTGNASSAGSTSAPPPPVDAGVPADAAPPPVDAAPAIDAPPPPPPPSSEATPPRKPDRRSRRTKRPQDLYDQR